MNKLIIGDCRKIMRKLIKDGIKVQACVISPPYYCLHERPARHTTADG